MTYHFAERITALKPSAIREILKATSDPNLISLAAGSPDSASFPKAEMQEIANQLFEQQAVTALQYGITEGYTPLREQTMERMKSKYQTGSENDDIIITTGGQQVIHLLTSVMISEGDVVIAEDPSFVGALNCFRSAGAVLKGVSMDDEGMKMDELEEILRTTDRVKFVYVIPTFQNPSGRTMSLARRKKLLELADQYDFLILEDGPYFELRFSGDPVPNIKSMDTSGRVIFSGSYSKVLSPGMRIGFAIGPKEVIGKMTISKQTSDVHTNLFFQMMVSEYLKQYDIDAHIAEIRKLYTVKRDAMVAACEKYFDKRVPFTRPDGGLFLWGELPEGYSGFELCKRATARLVAAVPGSAFSVDEDPNSRGFRMNYSLPTVEQIDKGVAILGEVMREYLAE